MKKLLLPVVLVSVLGALSGCASDQPQAQTTTTSTTTEETSIQPVSPTSTTTERTTVQNQ